MTDSNLIEYFDAPARIMVEGTEYELHPLDLSDWVAAEARIRNKRLTQIVENQAVRMSLSDPIISGAIAQTVCQAITVNELFGEDAKVFMLCLSLRHGDPQFNGDAGVQKVKAFPPVTRKLLDDILGAIMGTTVVTEVEAADDDRPTENSQTPSSLSPTGEN